MGLAASEILYGLRWHSPWDIFGCSGPYHEMVESILTKGQKTSSVADLYCLARSCQHEKKKRSYFKPLNVLLRTKTIQIQLKRVFYLIMADAWKWQIRLQSFKEQLMLFINNVILISERSVNKDDWLFKLHCQFNTKYNKFQNLFSGNPLNNRTIENKLEISYLILVEPRKTITIL